MKNTTTSNTGTLYIVATPIGNLDDITKRAIETLSSVDTILAEDTRHSKKLLSALGIQKPLVALHDFNEKQLTSNIIEALTKGKNFALISDAGTPLISDPGYLMVKLARDNHISVVPIPGACALITALCASGAPTNAFTFAGFLPAKKIAREALLESYQATTHTLIFYESTHRIIDTLTDLKKIMGASRQIMLAKELTKTFEHFFRGCVDEILDALIKDPLLCKGEFVLIVPPKAEVSDIETHEKQALALLLQEVSLKQAVKIAEKLTGKNKNQLYQAALALKNAP